MQTLFLQSLVTFSTTFCEWAYVNFPLDAISAQLGEPHTGLLSPCSCSFLRDSNNVPMIILMAFESTPLGSAAGNVLEALFISPFHLAQV